jgi:antitoxin component YwqK of YwqJK toxin-antitoxin module
MLRLVFLLSFTFLLSCNFSGHEEGNKSEKFIEVKNTPVGKRIQEENVRVFLSDKDKSKRMVVTYWDNGNKQSVSFFKKLVKDSCWSKYYENESLLSIGCYRKGLKEGQFKYYHQNGKLALVEKYLAGRKVNEVHYDTLGVIQK